MWTEILLQNGHSYEALANIVTTSAANTSVPTIHAALEAIREDPCPRRVVHPKGANLANIATTFAANTSAQTIHAALEAIREDPCPGRVVHLKGANQPDD